MKRIFIRICLIAALAFTASAQPPAHTTSATDPTVEADTADDDDDDEEDDAEEEAAEAEAEERNVLENPVIEYDDEIDIPIPSFIKVSTNRIKLNGADWSRLRKAIAGTKGNTASIVHIGDSHVQADIGTGTTRSLLQFDYGDAGRGIITPLKMSGTNEPPDYVFSSTRPWDAVKLMKHPWRRTMGFTGTSITPTTRQSSITIGTTDREDYDPFSSFILFHRGKLNVTSVTDQSGKNLQFKAIPSRDYTQVLLSAPQTRVTVNFDNGGDLTLFGASLSGDRPGIFYNAIGNNGATYATYNSIGGIGEGIRPLKPDLVVISLGTNEAFGRLDTRGFYNQIDRLVQDVRRANPDAQILLVTPMECQRSVYTTKTKTVKVPAGNRRKKRKGRRTSSRRTTTKRVKTKTRSYAVNSNIAPLRDEILRYGKDHGIAVYDWYEVAGGNGASSTWINNGYFSADRVHHSAKGYHLQGRLLYEALIDEFGRKQ